MSHLALNCNSEIANQSTNDCSTTQPDVLANIYDDDINIAVWQRDISEELAIAVNDFLSANTHISAILAVSPQNTQDVLYDTFGKSKISTTLCNDIALLVDMFCCLFGLKRAGLRLTALDNAMCPRFHVDRIPCRLVTTYQGVATQWLSNNAIDRTKLGVGHLGKPDEKSGLFTTLNDINYLTQGDVALLKGENWSEKDGAGLVHRSPPMPAGERRLLMTLDFIDD